jgi:hypothetical protein
MGAFRVPLDVFFFGLAPASPPGLSLTLCASAGTEPGNKCGVGQLVMTRSADCVVVAVPELGSAHHVFVAAMASHVGIDPKREINFDERPDLPGWRSRPKQSFRSIAKVGARSE